MPLVGNDHVYTVSKVLWPAGVETWIAEHFIGKVLHVCCGQSKLGHVRLDLYAHADVRADAARLPFADGSFDTVLIDPPYSAKFQWNHDMLNELHRVASQRIIFQHWYCPINAKGQFRKAHVYRLTDAAAVPYINGDLRMAVKDGDEHYLVVEDTGGMAFGLTDLTFWTPRSYFGRVQLISVFDRYVS